MTWGWLKPVLELFGKLFGVGFLIHHGKVKADKKRLENDNEALREYAKIDSSPDPDDPADEL